jgi:flagellar basal-body rod modification protein FlgD
MEDREFIAQMAQFSSLEQMTEINKEIASLSRSTRTAEAFSLLGKKVDALSSITNRVVSGIVSSIRYHDGEQVLVVGGQEISLGDVQAVHRTEPETAPAKTADPAKGDNGNKMTKNKDVSHKQ